MRKDATREQVERSLRGGGGTDPFADLEADAADDFSDLEQDAPEAPDAPETPTFQPNRRAMSPVPKMLGASQSAVAGIEQARPRTTAGSLLRDLPGEVERIAPGSTGLIGQLGGASQIPAQNLWMQLIAPEAPEIVRREDMPSPGAALWGAGDAWTFGNADEGAAALRTLVDSEGGRPEPGAYTANLGALRALRRGNLAEDPAAYAVGNLGATGAQAGIAAPAEGGAAARLAQMGATGIAEGGLAGSGFSEAPVGSERWARDTGAGAALGGGLSLGGGLGAEGLHALAGPAQRGADRLLRRAVGMGGSVLDRLREAGVSEEAINAFIRRHGLGGRILPTSQQAARELGDIRTAAGSSLVAEAGAIDAVPAPRAPTPPTPAPVAPLPPPEPVPAAGGPYRGPPLPPQRFSPVPGAQFGGAAADLPAPPRAWQSGPGLPVSGRMAAVPEPPAFRLGRDEIRGLPGPDDDAIARMVDQMRVDARAPMTEIRGQRGAPDVESDPLAGFDAAATDTYSPDALGPEAFERLVARARAAGVPDPERAVREQIARQVWGPIVEREQVEASERIAALVAEGVAPEHAEAAVRARAYGRHQRSPSMQEGIAAVREARRPNPVPDDVEMLPDEVDVAPDTEAAGPMTTFEALDEFEGRPTVADDFEDVSADAPARETMELTDEDVRPTPPMPERMRPTEPLPGRVTEPDSDVGRAATDPGPPPVTQPRPGTVDVQPVIAAWRGVIADAERSRTPGGARIAARAREHLAMLEGQPSISFSDAWAQRKQLDRLRRQGWAQGPRAALNEQMNAAADRAGRGREWRALNQDYQIAQTATPGVRADARASDPLRRPSGGELVGGALSGGVLPAARRAAQYAGAGVGSGLLEAFARVARTDPAALGRFARPFTLALRRGPQAMAATFYSLSQQSPEFRQMVNEKFADQGDE